MSDAPRDAGWAPGQLLPAAGMIILNPDRATITVEVTHTGPTPIEVGSHYHFVQVNPALRFDRDAARGFRLNIPAGDTVRFQPAETRLLELVELAGEQTVPGLRRG